MKILTGALQPDEGVVRFDGVSIGDDLSAAKRRVGYLPETNPLYPEMLVSEYLEFTCELRNVRGAERTRALARVVERTGIEAVFTRPIAQLSKGYRQRTGLAAAIIHEPEILILDEPTEGLDPNQRVGIRHLVSEIGKERTVILSTHVLAEVEATCSRLLIIHQGGLAADGSAAELLSARSSGPRYVVEAAGTDIEENLRTLPGVVSLEGDQVEGRVRVKLTATGDEDLRPRIFRAATENHWVLWELHRERESLEHLFRELTTSVEADGPRPDGSLEVEPEPEVVPGGGA
jgi:ABC-2 type transport system ATP-binding protein